MSGWLRNEHGGLIGLDRSMNIWRISGYLDFAHHARPIYNADKPSNTIKTMGEIEYLPSQYTALSLRYTMSDKEKNVTGLELLRHEYKHCLRLQGQMELGSFNIVPMLSACVFQPALGKVDWGRMASVRAAYRKKSAKFQLWGAWFHTDSYASALYSYQPMLHYDYYSPSLYYHGVATTATAEVTAGRFILGVKLSDVFYSNRSSIGTGDRMINGSSKWDLGLELCYLM